MFGNINNCHNVKDFRNLAKKRLPSPIFHYIDGAADDEITYKRNTDAYEQCDLIPNVLSGVDKVDMSTTVMGQKLDIPLYCAPTALQRLFHHEGEIGVAKAAEKFGTMFGISSLGTASIEEISNLVKTPKLFQLYVHKDKGLNKALIERCKESNFFPNIVVDKSTFSTPLKTFGTKSTSSNALVFLLYVISSSAAPSI